jgi:hypothetical protein
MSIFEEVKSQLNIRQVIEHYGVKVNRANFFICPFHNDHKPSASIKNNYFNCFVCGAGGDLISFTAKYLGLSNLDATKQLIKEFNLNIDISTPEERKAQYIAHKKRQAEIKKETTFRDRYKKDKELRQDIKKPTLYKLRNEVRQTAIKNEREKEEYIRRVGLILADMHRFLWQGIHLYPYEHKRHILGLQELTACQYFIDCYDSNADEFIKDCKGVIEKYERTLDILDK